MDVIVRFWGRVNKTATCWLWLGAPTPDGYGRLFDKGFNWAVHRWAYARLVGSIPDGMWVLHKCDVRACVNPDHLYLGTVLENNRDTTNRGRHAEALKIQCPRGHEYDATNTISQRGRNGKLWRQCRICRNQGFRDLRKRRRERM